MQRIILDTNAVVSALISNSIPTKILYDLVFRKAVQSCLSENIFEEYVAVLSRDKFNKFPEFKSKSEVVLTKLQEVSQFYQINQKVEILSDMSDNKFLELATASAADYLITGNTLDFTLTEFEYTKM